MNVLFTGLCNRSCPYCFAKGKMNSAASGKDSFLNLTDLKVIIDFLKRSGQNNFKILGGEPTLHPKFKDAVKMILDQGFNILIFSNGIIRHDLVDFLKKIPQDRLTMTLNINNPGEYSKKEWSMLETTMEKLNKRITLGFTIYKVDFDMDFLPECIIKHNLNRHIRLGIANPIYGESNEHISLRGHKKIAPAIVRFAKRCNKIDTTIRFDCGFTLCSFTEEEIGKLYCNAILGIIAYCSSPIDVGPGLEMWHCFSTSTIWNRNLKDFEDLNQIHKFYWDKISPFRRVGAMNRCFKCSHLRQNRCAGGCLAHTLDSFNLR